MDPAKFEVYVKDRYQDQVDWYSDKASLNKRYYTFFQWGVIVASASVPVLIKTLSGQLEWLTIIIALLLAIGTTVLKTFKYQEIWINYRTIAETLKKEWHFYDTGLDVYAHTADKEGMFVTRVEALISRENYAWLQMQLSKEEEKKKPAPPA
jgi:hypothetical protein